MKYIIIMLLAVNCMAQSIGEQFPENPTPVKTNASGGYETDKSKLPEKKPVFTKFWISTHAAYLSTIVWDVEMTHAGVAHRHCVELNSNLPKHPSRGELYRSNIAEFAVGTGFDLAMQALHPPKAFAWLPYLAAGYGGQDHFRGGLSWTERCW